MDAISTGRNKASAECRVCAVLAAVAMLGACDVREQKPKTSNLSVDITAISQKLTDAVAAAR